MSSASLTDVQHLYVNLAKRSILKLMRGKTRTFPFKEDIFDIWKKYIHAEPPVLSLMDHEMYSISSDKIIFDGFTLSSQQFPFSLACPLSNFVSQFSAR